MSHYFVADSTLMPLEEGIVAARTRLQQEESKLVDIIARKDAEVAAVVAKHRPIEEQQRVVVAQAQHTYAQLQGQLEAWRKDIQRKPLPAYTLDDVKHALLSLSIEYDGKMMGQNSVSGELLSALSNEDEVRDVTGIKSLGDCTRVLQMVRHITAGKGLPKPVDITHDGNPEFVSTWGVEQVLAEIGKNAQLSDCIGVLRGHKIAGDILLDMDPVAVIPQMGITPIKRLALKKELLSLRARIEAECKDAITINPGVLVSISIRISH